ncbi:hypothetical protein ACFIQF_18465 [Comamonas sp. J-3]|uniref:hypothetical protein n=1 Tax=Comamonas trifloxystrobinivorans TaxID=3350256 RepID=UPI0037290A0F
MKRQLMQAREYGNAVAWQCQQQVGSGKHLKKKPRCAKNLPAGFICTRTLSARRKSRKNGKLADGERQLRECDIRCKWPFYA